MANLPPELKQLKRFIREAKKTQKISPAIAYFCRLYAIQEAMKLDESKKTDLTNQWMADQMTQLEANKVAMSREEGQQKITTMAHNVFKHADEIDRAGNANKSTAAAFNSAFVFYTILKQFGDRDQAIVEAAKYCMFKTTDILKALKEGRKPKIGAPGEEEEEEELNKELNALDAGSPAGDIGGGGMGGASEFKDPAGPPTYDSLPASGYSSPQQPMNSSSPVQPSGYQQPPPQQNQYQQPPPQQNQYQPPPQQQQQQQPMGGGGAQYYVNNGPQYNYQKQMALPQFENKVTACVEAEKHMKEAQAALRFEDVDTAIKKAEEAIAILKPHR